MSRATYITYGIGVIVLVGLVIIAILLWIDRDGTPIAAIEEPVPPSVDTLAPEPSSRSLPTPSQGEEYTEMIVNALSDAGEGSLRQALLDANSSDQLTRISFDQKLFADPQAIVLETSLPEIRGHVIIDGYIPDQLWRATGVTVSGGSRVRVFEIAEDSHVEIRSLSIVNGSAKEGAAIYNRGDLVISSITFQSNTADEQGGALANYGQATIVNSTFLQNSARWGGAVANLEGRLNVTHATFSENQGGALASSGELLLRNNILANSINGVDCLAEVDIDPLTRAISSKAIKGVDLLSSVRILFSISLGTTMVRRKPYRSALGALRSIWVIMRPRSTRMTIHLFGTSVGMAIHAMSWDSAI